MIAIDNPVHSRWIYEDGAYTYSYVMHTNIYANLHSLQTAMCSRSMEGTMRKRHEMTMAVQPDRSSTWLELSKLPSMIERAAIDSSDFM